jgi:hypothetical protein
MHSTPPPIIAWSTSLASEDLSNIRRKISTGADTSKWQLSSDYLRQDSVPHFWLHQNDRPIPGRLFQANQPEHRGHHK